MCPKRRPIPQSALDVAVMPYECICRTLVLLRWLIGAYEYQADALGQDLAEFHAPLVERINLSDRA